MKPINVGNVEALVVALKAVAEYLSAVGEFPGMSHDAIVAGNNIVKAIEKELLDEDGGR